MKSKRENENKRNEILTVANGITLFRMIGTVGLFFLSPSSAPFLWIYTFTGLTDVLDGWIARRTKTTSKFGATLDSIADLLFYAVMLIKILPVLWERLPKIIWCVVAVILLIRLASYTVAAIKFRRFAAVHTYLNKVTGFSVFLLPYALLLSWEGVYSWIVCALALFSSLEELLIHLSRKEYPADAKTIFNKK